MQTRGESTYKFLRDDLVAAGDLTRLVERHAAAEGANQHDWPGLTFYRFSRPVPSHWDEVSSLSYCLIVQGAKRVRIGSEEHVYDPMRYLVLNRRSRFEVEIIEASQARPFLSFVLQIEPALVSDVLASMHRPMVALYQEKPRRAAHVAPLDAHLIGATYRFVTSIESDVDGAVLGPMYLREIVYRLLQSEERHRLIDASRGNENRNPVSAAIEHMKTHIEEPISVSALAEAVYMSESAFAHLFKQSVGTSPYQFLKQLRLEQARDLLLDDDSHVSVSKAATRVGYTSLSHFISEFKRYFGETPGAYLQRLHGVETFTLHSS